MDERTVSRKRVFDGKLLKLDVLQVELEDGRRATREVICHPGAAVILGRRKDGQFVLVRQYRKAVELELLEVVAGTRDEGESPEACAYREMREESGYRVEQLHELGQIVPVPGYSQEVLYLYWAELETEPESLELDEDEQVEVVVMSGTEIEQSIASGEMIDAKSIALWYRCQQYIVKQVGSGE